MLNGAALLPVNPPHSRTWAKLDLVDYAAARHLQWRLSPLGYVNTHSTTLGRGKCVSLGAFVGNRMKDVGQLGKRPTRSPLYLNGNPMDCRRANLTYETGTTADTRGGYVVKLHVGNRKEWLGRWRTKTDAERVFLLAKRWIHDGEPPPENDLGQAVGRYLDGLYCDLETKAVAKASDLRTGLAQGIDVHSAEVWATDETTSVYGFRGAVNYGFDGLDSGWDGDHAFILTALAGPAANRLQKKRRLSRSWAIMFTGMADIEKAKRLLCRHPLGNELQLEKELFREAEQLLERHWSAVEKVSQRLLVADFVYRDELTALMAR